MELSERARELLRKTAMNYESHAKTLEKESGVTLDYAQRFITHQLAFLFAEAKMKLENDEVFLCGANERIRQQRETIASQQAEIEHLRAALENIVARDVYPDLNINEAEIYRIAKESLTPAELGEMVGKAEVVKESLWCVYSMNGGEFLEVAKLGSYKEILINQDKKWERIAWCETLVKAKEYMEMVVNSRKTI